MEFDFGRLKQLTETSSVPGYEGRIRVSVREGLEATTDSVRVDGMGNVVGTIEGESDYEVVAVAHMGEIGFMVRHVNDGGFLRFGALGGWNPRVLKTQHATVHTEGEDLTGVIGPVPPHTLTEEQKQKEPKAEDVYVDFGLSAETIEEAVSVGDLVTVEQTTVRMGNHVTGKATDDHVYPFAMLETAKHIENPEVTIHLAATVQEKAGLRGAQALGVNLDPDFALGLDTTVADGVPDFDPADHATKLDADAGIKLKDSSAIANPKVHRHLRAVAEDDDIPHQMELLPAGGIDTGGFQNGYGAKPAGAISMPTRYLHTTTKSVHGDDVVAYIDPLTALLESKTGEFDYTL